MKRPNELTATTRTIVHSAFSLSALALATTAALAQQQTSSNDEASPQRVAINQTNDRGASRNRELMPSWTKMRGELVEADELLSADVSSSFNPVGKVTDLVLTPDHRQVQYILYETPYPWSFWGGEDGFARYDGVQLENDDASFDLTLRLDAEDSAGAPEELTLTRDQARERLVSRVIGRAMVFEDDVTREIDDILINRDTGAVAYYVIDTNEDSVFRGERRTVPAAEVMITDDGQLSASLRLSELDNMQVYDSALL